MLATRRSTVVPRKRLVGASFGFVLLLSACGGSGGDGTLASRSDGAKVDAGTVQVKAFRFQPSPITITVGETVTWINRDAILHTVTSGTPGEDLSDSGQNANPPKPDGLFDEKLDGKEATAEFTFDEAGTYDYYCDIHKGMHGEIVVE